MTAEVRIARHMVADRNAEAVFLATCALLFVASTAVTIVWCGSMSAMSGMSMPGGWTMSMTWMRMPGQTRLAAATSFVDMWVVMMVAMMLPSLVPMLARYRQAVVNGETRLGMLTTIVGLAYFVVWGAIGLTIHPIGTVLADLEMQHPALSRVVPLAMGIVVASAGAVQFTRWKAHHLACCRESPGRGSVVTSDIATAWRHGVRLGLHCVYSSAGLTALVLVAGVMDLRAMAAVTAVITAERLAPAGERVAKIFGSVVVAIGLLLIARASGI